jgi:hypothetical protein
MRGKAVYFIRIFKDLDGACLNFESRQRAQRYSPITVCPDYETWFQGGIPQE